MNDILYEEFLKKIKEAVNKAQYNSSDKLLETGNMNKFFHNIFFRESMKLMPNEVTEFFLKSVKKYISFPPGSTNSEQKLFFAQVLISLFQNSIDFYNGSEDLLNRKQHSLLIEIGSEIYKNDKPIRKSFKQLINSSSRKSPTQIIAFIYELDKYAEQRAPSSSIEWLFEMILDTITDIDSLLILISNVHTINESNPQYKVDIIKLIQNSFHNIIINNPSSYTNFFYGSKDSQNIVYFYHKVDDWKPFDDNLSLKTILYLLQPNQINIETFIRTDLFQFYSQINEAQDDLLNKILNAIKFIYETYLCTNLKDVLSPILIKINEYLISFYFNNYENNNSNDFLFKILPSCLLFLDPNLFESLCLPKLQKDPSYLKNLKDIICTVGPLINSNRKDYELIYNQLFKLLNSLIMESFQIKELSQIINAMKQFPNFFRSFFFENVPSFQKLFENGFGYNHFDLLYFNLNMVVEQPFWFVTKTITDSLIKLLEKNFSCILSSEFGKFCLNIIHFLNNYFQTPNCEYSKDDLITIIYNFEAISYISMSANTKESISNSNTFLSILCKIIRKLKLKTDVSKESILRSINKTTNNPCKEFALINKKYNIDLSKNISKGWRLTVSILTLRFENLTRSYLKKRPGQNELNENNSNESNNQASQNQENQEQPEIQPEKVIITDKILDEFRSCIYILFSLIREPSPKIEEFISLILSDDEKIGSYCSLDMANAISPIIHYNIVQLINTSFIKFASRKSNNAIPIGFVANSIEFMKILFDNNIWIPNPNYSNMFTSILNNLVALCIQLNSSNINSSFCQLIISLFEMIKRVDFEIYIDSKIRNNAGKTIVNWINKLALPEKDKTFEIYYLALYSLLDGINFCENNSLKVNSEAYESFMFYYSQRRISDTLISTILTNNNERKYFLVLLDNGNRVIDCFYYQKQNYINRIESTVSILKPILKNNFDLCINHIISLAFDSKTKLRTSFINALSSSLTPEAYSEFVNPKIKRTVIDLIFENDLEILELLATKSPYKSGEIAESIIQASALKKIEIAVFEKLAKIEIQNNKDPTRNTLFRGNGISSKAISYFPKYFAKQWVNELIHPLLSLDKSNLKVFWNALILRIEEMFLVMPARLKLAIRILFNLLAPESTEIAFSMLSGFIFLRFLCPMLAKIEGLVEASSLLMNASIRPTIGENRSQFNYMKNEVADSYNRIRKLFKDIVCFQLYEADGINYNPPPIEIKPLNPSPNAENIKSDLVAALWTQMAFIQKEFHQTLDNDPIHSTLDQLITKLKEEGNPNRKINPISIETVLNIEGLLNPPLIELFQMNKQQDPMLEKWFYLTSASSGDGTLVFIMDMSELKQPFTAQQLCAYLFSQVLSIGDAKYSVFVEFADFNIELLPPLSQLKKTVKLATDGMMSRLVAVYVGRVQENAINYLNKASKLLKKIPLKIVSDLKMVREEIGDLKLSKGTNEYFSPPEASFPLQEKSNYPIIRLHKKSIQIIDKAEINQIEFFTSQVFLLSNIENIGHSQAPKSVSSFTIRMKSGQFYNIQSPSSIHLRQSVYQLFHRYHDEKVGQKLYVDRSTFLSLLLIISFVNMLSDNGDEELKNSSLNLYNTMIESSGLKTNIEEKYFSLSEIPFSLFHLVGLLAADLAIENPNEVHGFFFEFVKIIPFLSEKDYANSVCFLKPFIKHAADQIIKNQVTLNCLAQISSLAPKNCFMQFNKNIWSNFSHMELLDVLFDKLCSFEDSCFGSIFLYIATNHSSEVTDFLMKKMMELANDLTQRQFGHLAQILNCMIVSELFDSSFRDELFYKLSLVRLLGFDNLVKPCFLLFQAISCNTALDIESFSCTPSLLNFINVENENISSINNNDQIDKPVSLVSIEKLSSQNFASNKSTDYRNFISNTAKLALAYREHYSEKLLNLFMEDAKDLFDGASGPITPKDLVRKLNGLVFVSALKNDYKFAFEVYKKFFDFDPMKAIAVCSISLSIAINSIPSDLQVSLFFTSVASVLYTAQTSPFDLIFSIFEKNQNAFFDSFIQKVAPEKLVLFDSITNLNFSKEPLFSFLLIIINFYGRGMIDLPSILCSGMFQDGKESISAIILLLFRFNFDASIEKEVFSILIENERDLLGNEANFAALIIIICLRSPSDHMKRLLMKMLEVHPEYFINIDFAAFYSRSQNQFKSFDTKLLVLLTKATCFLKQNGQIDHENKFKLDKIIKSIFDGENIEMIDIDQTSNIFNSFLATS